MISILLRIGILQGHREALLHWVASLLATPMFHSQNPQDLRVSCCTDAAFLEQVAHSPLCLSVQVAPEAWVSHVNLQENEVFQLRPLLSLLLALCIGGWGGECIACHTDMVLHGYQGLQLPILVVGLVYITRHLVSILLQSTTWKNASKDLIAALVTH